jgi:polyhydroxyalkanoate synthesis regulator phasin
MLGREAQALPARHEHAKPRGRREEARDLIDEFLARWRGDASRLGERAGATLDGLFRELGLVTKDDVEDLELRIAQLEHRLRLLEELPARDSTPPVQH